MPKTKIFTRILYLAFYNYGLPRRKRLEPSDVLPNVNLFNAVQELHIMSVKKADDPDLAQLISTFSILRTLSIGYDTVPYRPERPSDDFYVPRWPFDGNRDLELEATSCGWEAVHLPSAHDEGEDKALIDITSVVQIALPELKHLRTLMLDRISCHELLSAALPRFQLERLHVSRSPSTLNFLEWVLDSSFGS